MAAEVTPQEEEIVPEEVVEETVESPEEEVETPAEEVEAETPEEPVAEEPDEKPPSPRESLRIQKLIERMKGQETPTAPKIPGTLDYATALDADPEVIKQIETETRRREQVSYDEGLKRANSIQFHTRLEIDAPRMEAKYPRLDPQAPTFDPIASDAISQWYLATAGYNRQTGEVQNADIRYADFVEGIMELVGMLAEEKTTQTARTIAKQAAQTGLRPGGTVTKSLNLNQDPSDMSDEELDAKLATVFHK